MTAIWITLLAATLVAIVAACTSVPPVPTPDINATIEWAIQATKDAAPTQTPAPTPTPTPVFEVSDVQLSKEFASGKEGRAAADAKYRNKSIIVYGIIDRITKGPDLTDVICDLEN